jgi:hypothetical protein
VGWEAESDGIREEEGEDRRETQGKLEEIDY